MTKSDILIWILVAISFVAAILNIQKKAVGFFIWAGADAVLVIIYLYKIEYGTAVLFLMYTILNIYGGFNWSRDEKKLIRGQ